MWIKSMNGVLVNCDNVTCIDRSSGGIVVAYLATTEDDTVGLCELSADGWKYFLAWLEGKIVGKISVADVGDFMAEQGRKVLAEKADPVPTWAQ